jgi:hypothetical protein
MVCLGLFWGASAVADDAAPAKDAPKEDAKATATPAPDSAKDGAAAATDQTAAKKSAGGKWVSGSFDTDFRADWDGRGADFSSDQTLRLNVDPPDYPKLHLRGMLWMHEDYDGHEPSNSALRDINESYQSAVRARPLQLYAQIDDLWGQSVLRVGRQRILEGALLNRIDGVYFAQKVQNWNWYVFGGIRASIYRETWEDYTFGGGVAWTPFPYTRLAIDAAYGRELRPDAVATRTDWFSEILPLRFVRKVDGEATDLLVSLSARQNIGPNVTLNGRLDLKDGLPDHAVFDVVGTIPQSNTTLQFTYRGQLKQATDRIDDMSIFYGTLGALDRYHDFLVSARQPFLERFSVALEAEVHESISEGTSYSNRDYQRYALVLSADPLVWGLNTTVSLDRWAEAGRNGFWTVTGEVGKKWKPVEVAIGTDFQAYEERIVRYNPYPNGISRVLTSGLIPGFFYIGPNPIVFVFDKYAAVEHTNVYALYTKAKWHVAKDQDLTFSLSYETDSGPGAPYWRARTGYSIRF